MSAKPTVGHQARKRFGQNFLQDSRIIERIITCIAPQQDDTLVEIGPGLGALTEPLLKAAGKLNVVEIDRDLIPVLKTQFFSYPEFNIHQGDALEFDFASLKQNKPLRLVGNLPYNISTPIIFHLLQKPNIIQDMHFMLQKEVVERLAANPGGKDYGRLSIMAQYHCTIEQLFIVPPSAFNPEPKVDSAIVRLIPHQQKPYLAHSEEKLAQVVREAFHMRRKTLKNNLKSLISSDELQAIGIDSSLRPEKITVADYVKIANALV